MKPRRSRLIFHILCFLSIFFSCSVNAQSPKLRLGAEQTEEYLPMLKGKKVALIINQTSTLGKNNTHLLDTLLSEGIDVTTIFAPEHGFRGNADAGEIIKDGKDVKTGIPIISLYGKNKKPSAQQLSNIDILVFDIQDVGARFYTYISTMFYAMQAASENGKMFMVLDRPNPNDYVDGPMLNPRFKSFVGALPLPVLHGLTVGELALMIEGERWVENKGDDWLKVVKMSNWQHGQPYSLPIKPSPNLPNDQSIRLYPALCLFEGTNISVGRGTHFPFQVVGYPSKNLGEFFFTPVAMVGSDKNPLQKDKLCYGLDLRLNQDIKGFDLSTILYFKENWPATAGPLITRSSFFDLLAGTDELRKQINQGMTQDEIRQTWEKDLEEYRKTRGKYLLYK